MLDSANSWVYNIIVRRKKFLQSTKTWDQIRRSHYDVSKALPYEE